MQLAGSLSDFADQLHSTVQLALHQYIGKYRLDELLNENEALRQLKELKYLERICDKVGSISVSNGGGLLTQLQELVR